MMFTQLEQKQKIQYDFWKVLFSNYISRLKTAWTILRERIHWTVAKNMKEDTVTMRNPNEKTILKKIIANSVT